LKLVIQSCHITKWAFSWMKTTLSIVDGASELHIAFTASPAVERIRSDGALVQLEWPILFWWAMTTWGRYPFVISTKPKHHCVQSTTIYTAEFIYHPYLQNGHVSTAGLFWLFHGTGDWANSQVVAASFIPLKLVYACSCCTPECLSMSTPVRFHVRAKSCTADASRRVQTESRNFISDAAPECTMKLLCCFVVRSRSVYSMHATFVTIWF